MQAPSNLTAQTFAGLRWTYLSTAAGAALQIGFAAVMGRLLEPRAFGLLALSQLVLRFGTYFARMGIGPALIQKAELTRDDVRAGFTSSAGLGALFTAIFAAGAGPVAVALGEPQVAPVLRLMSVSLLLTGLSTTAQSLLRRDLRFKTLAVIDVGSYAVAYFGLGLPLALGGAGVAALVAAVLGQSAIQAVVTYAVRRHAVRPLARAKTYRALYGFGGRVSAISFLEFLGGNLDTFAVGRYAGAAALGQYSRAYLLTSLPMYQLTTGLSKVLFPGLSRIQGDIGRVRSAYLSAVGVSATILVPTCAGLAVAAPEVVRVVLGPQWDPAASVLPLLALAAAANLLTHFAGVVCEAVAQLRAKLRLQAGYLVVLVALVALAALAPGRPLQAIAVAFAVGELLRHAAYVVLMRRVLGVGPADLRVRYGPALVAAAAVAGVLAGGRAALLAADAPTLLVLLAEIALGALTLIGLLRLGLAPIVRDDLVARLRNAGALRAGSASNRLARLALGRAAVPRVPIVPRRGPDQPTGP